MARFVLGFRLFLDLTVQGLAGSVPAAMQVFVARTEEGKKAFRLSGAEGLLERPTQPRP